MPYNEDDFWEYNSQNNYFHNICNNDKVMIYDFARIGAVPIEVRLKNITEIIQSLSTYERIALLNLYCPLTGELKKK
jgi:hypothetical protein